MGLTDAINRLTLIIIVVFVIVLAIGIAVGVVFYFVFLRKRRAKMEDSETDYSGLERSDSKDYLKFDDIKDRMIIADNGTRFIAAIRCRGYEYYSAYIGERVNTQAGYRGFINTITTPITYRQYSKSVDLDYTNEKYKKAHRKIEEQLFVLNEDYQETKKTLEELKLVLGDKVSESEEVRMVLDSLEEKQKQIKNLEWRRFHLEDQMEYHAQISGNAAEPEATETYIFDWEYHPFDFPVDLSKEEVYQRAMKELSKKASSYIHALSAAGVKAMRCSSAELVEMCRRHMNPVSSDRYKLDFKNLEDNSFFKDILTTSLKDELDDEYADTMEYTMTKVLEDAAIEVQKKIIEDAAGVAYQQVEEKNRESTMFSAGKEGGTHDEK